MTTSKSSRRLKTRTSSRCEAIAVCDRRRRTTEYKAISSGYIATWYLDEDDDGDCFVDRQMFFDFKCKPAMGTPTGPASLVQIADSVQLRTRRGDSSTYRSGASTRR
jgi:hypothetical protein